MSTNLWTLANTDWVQLFVIVLGLLIGGGGWLFNKVREAQAEHAAKMRRAQKEFDVHQRGSTPQDLAARRREQLQELARQRNQRSGGQQPSAPRTPQQTSAQRPQGRPQAQSRPQPARRPQPQQRQQQQPARQQSATRRSANQRPAAATQPSSERSLSQKAAPLQVQKVTSPVTEEDLVEIAEITGGPNLLGTPLAKALILKEVLDRPVGMRDPQRHPLELTD